MYRSLRDRSKELKGFEKAKRLGLKFWQGKNVAEEVKRLEREVMLLTKKYDSLHQD